MLFVTAKQRNVEGQQLSLVVIGLMSLMSHLGNMNKRRTIHSIDSTLKKTSSKSIFTNIQSPMAPAKNKKRRS